MTLPTVVLTLNLFAYIGPGGGIALLGPLFGVILAAVGALLMIVLWPIRMMLKKSRTGSGGQNAAAAAGGASPESVESLT